jgi:antitoxin component of MazEF toxin-antitoxin module
MIKKMVKIGNSVGVILDKFILKELDWSGGDLVEVRYFPAAQKVAVRKLGKSGEDLQKAKRYRKIQFKI